MVINKSRDGKWFICPTDDTSNAYAAGYDGNVFETEAEALSAIPGLAVAMSDNGANETYWSAAQY